MTERDRELLAAAVALIVICLIALPVLWFVIDVALPAIGFDGNIGAGCDPGNPNCEAKS